MSTPERATIHVVTPEQEAAAAAAPPPSPPASTEPEAQPPGMITPPPPQELEKDLGGPALPSPTADERVAAAGGSVADRLRARYQGMAATEEFSVPGYELADGRPGLVLVARTFGDRKAFNEGVSNEVFIAKSTHALYLVDEDGSREPIEGGWGPGLAAMIGVSVTKASDLVALVISRPDPSNSARRIPNVAGIGKLAQEIVAWAQTNRRDTEETLGE
jgi:hypothetical protein